MSDHPITLVVAAIIRRNNKMLICQRMPAGSYASLWEFPGGKVEYGESPEDALIRELREELNILAEVDAIFDVASIIVEDRHIVLLFYLCTLIDGDPQPIECQATQWVPATELDQYQFPPADEKVLMKLKAM